jgi:hypothetical protein
MPYISKATVKTCRAALKNHADLKGFRLRVTSDSSGIYVSVLSGPVPLPTGSYYEEAPTTARVRAAVSGICESTGGRDDVDSGFVPGHYFRFSIGSGLNHPYEVVSMDITPQKVARIVSRCQSWTERATAAASLIDSDLGDSIGGEETARKRIILGTVLETQLVSAIGRTQAARFQIMA